MALPRRIDRLVLSGAWRLVRPTAGMAHRGEQAAIAGCDDLEAAAPSLYFGARLTCRAGSRLAGCAECRLDLIERRRFGRLGVAHAFPGSDCFE